MTPISHAAMNPALLLGAIIIALLVGTAIFLCFILSARKTMRLVPQEHYPIPMWLLWLYLALVVVPFATIILAGPAALHYTGLSTGRDLFSVLLSAAMLFYAIPTALSQYLSANEEGKKKANVLKNLGMFYVICEAVPVLLKITIGLPISLGLIVAALGVARLVLFIIYWAKLVSIRQCFSKEA